MIEMIPIHCALLADLDDNVIARWMEINLSFISRANQSIDYNHLPRSPVFPTSGIYGTQAD
ncbi:hypothetical protein [Nitratireductor aestuarii]|uniref:hypothetical protein n=1 Tax=Nitratireductor aestuarii TaxID=1735103 RepID=UPI001663B0DF|nr:hypothetical protein [Nitratireductor aestuarii]